MIFVSRPITKTFVPLRKKTVAVSRKTLNISEKLMSRKSFNFFRNGFCSDLSGKKMMGSQLEKKTVRESGNDFEFLLLCVKN